jgi:ATP-dependent Clp protease ATP-binding subunit ClpC
MFERFTDSGRRVVRLTQEAARLLCHNYIGTEHLVLALCQNGLERDDPLITGGRPELTMARLHEYAGDIAPPGATAPSGHIPFTPDIKRVLEASLQLALRYRHTGIDWVHLALAVLEVDEGNGIELLRQIEPDQDALAARVTDRVQRWVPEGPSLPRPHDPGGPRETRLATLERQVAELTEQVARLRARLDERDQRESG